MIEFTKGIRPAIANPAMNRQTPNSNGVRPKTWAEIKRPAKNREQESTFKNPNFYPAAPRIGDAIMIEIAQTENIVPESIMMLSMLP